MTLLWNLMRDYNFMGFNGHFAMACHVVIFHRCSYAKTVVIKVSCFDSEYRENKMVMVWFSHQIRKVPSEFCLEPYSMYPYECCVYVIYDVKHDKFNIALNGEPIYYCMTISFLFKTRSWRNKSVPQKSKTNLTFRTSFVFTKISSATW